MKLTDFNYHLPPERIAQHPPRERDAARMLLLDRSTGAWQDRTFAQLPHLLRGDELLVINNTRVLPARLFGYRAGLRAEPPGKHSHASREFVSAQIEVLLTRQLAEDTWQALVRPGRKVPVGERIIFGSGELEAEVLARGELGLREIRLQARDGNVRAAIERFGHIPLPPYIDRADEPEDRARYQTVFARQTGAVAAPTAGLHFTPAILDALRARGIEICEITLHVGLGTFQPIHADEIEGHHMHGEEYEITEAAAAHIHAARAAGRPILAIGTTVVRALEDAAQKAAAASHANVVAPGRAEATLFIQPGFDFRVVNQLLTNFHLPQSTLLVLVSAFAGRENILRAYAHAVETNYRFYSYGDCMLIR